MRASNTPIQLFLCFVLCCFNGAVLAQVPAFPGAQGFGAGAQGGRGGSVIYVTNLNDAGPGSLRAAIDADGPRTVVFRVGGTINLATSLVIQNPLITIAGQTAPGDGITLRLGPLEGGAALFVEAADVIIRHIRIRVGAASIGECCRDAITFFDGANRAIVDHVSLSWGTDETLNAWGTAKNITVQRSIISESLLLSSHADENGTIVPHGKGALFGDRADRISLHHNLLAHNNQRNPLINSNIGATYEHVNNVIYNYGDFASVFNGLGSEILKVNHIGNLYIAGDNSRLNRWEVGVQPGSATLVYVRDNLGPHRADGDDEFAIVGSSINFTEPAPTSFQSITPFATSAYPITSSPANSVLNNITQNVGATLPRQDTIDLRIIQQVRDREGRIINDPSEVGGWIDAQGGTAFADADQDGMSSAWERLNRLDPDNAADRNGDEDNDGYTNLEEFLNNTNPRIADTDMPAETSSELCFPTRSSNGSVSLVCI